MTEIYEPREDSYLLQKQVRIHGFGRVLDLGTGSGIQALTAVENPNVKEVVAVDINPEAVERLQQEMKERRLRKINVTFSDLFSNVAGCFHTIIFNPPYLPQDVDEGGRAIEDTSIYGGKKGYEMAQRFFASVSPYLFPEGKILFLFSSLTNKTKIDEILTHHLFEFKELERQKLAFEELYVYLIQKSAILKTLGGKGISGIVYYTRGRRGNVYTGAMDTTTGVKKFLPRKAMRQVAIKLARADSTAKERIANEGKWLQLLNRKNIGPLFIMGTEEYLVTEFVEGEYLLGWLEKNHSPEEVRHVMKYILEQCYTMDMLGINKEEMHHPHKHIIMNGFRQPIMVDFERCYLTKSPQNVTQFVEYICRLKRELAGQGITVDPDVLRQKAKEYKQSHSRNALQEMMAVLGA